MAPWSVLTSAYTFRDANHVLAFFASDLGAQMKKEAEDQLKIKILGPTFFGTRQVGLKPKKKITTPADMAGIKLRMPPGDAWQLLGRSIGANPTPIAFAETYTALQTGAVDGQDNPLPNVQTVKFYEVMSQIVLTSHLIAFDVLCMNLKTWNAMSPAKQKTFQAVGRQGARRGASAGAPEEGGGARRRLQEVRPRRSTRRTSTRSVPTRRRCTSPPTKRSPGRRGSSTRSPRSSSVAQPRVGPRPAAFAPIGSAAGVRCPGAGSRRVPSRGSSKTMNPTVRSASTGCGAARRTSLPACSASCSSAFLIQIVFRYFFNFPIGWSSELSVITWLYMVLLGSAFWLKETDEVRFDLISGSAGAARTARARTRRCGRGHRPVRHGDAGHHQVRGLHEGRELVVPQDPPRHPLFGLRRLRGRHHRPLRVGDREPCFAARPPEEADITKASSGL